MPPDSTRRRKDEDVVRNNVMNFSAMIPTKFSMSYLPGGSSPQRSMGQTTSRGRLGFNRLNPGLKREERN